jgi:hypothetical protein
MATLEFVPFPSLITQIGNMCRQGLSGIVQLVSDDNRMAQLHLRAGQIVYVMCRGRRGQDALDHMRTMRNARLSVDNQAAVSGDYAGLSTADILAYLSGSVEQLPVAGAATAATAASKPLAAAAPALAPAAFLTPQLRLACQQTLARYIGPMAEIVCDEHFDSAADARALAQALAGEIPGAEQSTKFKAEIARVLAGGKV